MYHVPHFSCIMCHISHVSCVTFLMYHVSHFPCIMCHISHASCVTFLMYHMSHFPCIMCHISHVSCVTFLMYHVSHFSCIMCHISHVLCVTFLMHHVSHFSCIMCHITHVSCVTFRKPRIWLSAQWSMMTALVMSSASQFYYEWKSGWNCPFYSFCFFFTFVCLFYSYFCIFVVFIFPLFRHCRFCTKLKARIIKSRSRVIVAVEKRTLINDPTYGDSLILHEKFLRSYQVTANNMHGLHGVLNATHPCGMKMSRI